MIYAHNEGAVLVTHDRELFMSRRSMPMGRVIRLDCWAEDGPDLLARHLPDVIHALARTPDLFLHFKTTNVSMRFGTEAPED